METKNRNIIFAQLYTDLCSSMAQWNHIPNFTALLHSSTLVYASVEPQPKAAGLLERNKTV